MTEFTLSRRAAFAAAMAAAPVLRANAQFVGGNLDSIDTQQGNMGTVGASDSGSIPLGGFDPKTTPGFPVLSGLKFPQSYWSPELLAQPILAEFGASGWITAINLDPPPNDANLQSEVEELRGMAKVQRQVRLPEIMAQLNNPLPYWGDMLMIKPLTAPSTWTLIATGVAVGQMVAMHFKLKFGRARPVQVYPALMPPAPTPQHPSYPNAHALQAQLITLCLKEVVPVSMFAPLKELALRVGKNREIAGFHFPSDTAASLTLAPLVFQKLKAGALFGKQVVEAKKDWPPRN
jgi:acid phosphatase (class A)